MPIVFLDLDGVMADFEGYFESHFGFRHDSVSDKEMWRLIDAHENFFGSLPPLPGALTFCDTLYDSWGGLPIILTACPRTNYFKAAIQKRDWVHNHISKRLHVLPVMGGKNKCLFMKQRGDVLIDDFEKNIVPWREMGGVGIVHTSFEDTLAKLKEVFW
jgi:hypothetical protein